MSVTPTRQKRKRLVDAYTPRQWELSVAQGAYTREVRACAVFCLSEGYPQDFGSFKESFLRDFTCTHTGTFVESAKGAPRHFVVHGQRSHNLSRPSVPVSVARIQRANRLRRRVSYEDEPRLANYISLLEDVFRQTRFSVVGRQWRSWMTIYQEPTRGHCYYVSALNMILHIPGVRSHVLSRFGVSRGATDADLFLDTFIDSRLGNDIWTHYTFAVTQTKTMRKRLGFDEIYTRIIGDRPVAQDEKAALQLLSRALQNKTDGGFSRQMVDSFLSVLGLDDDVVFVGAMDQTGRNIDESTLRQVTEWLANLDDTDQKKGCAIVIGASRDPKSGRTGGHAIAAVYDGSDLRFYNHGQTHTKNVLDDFLKTYSRNLKISWYEFELPRRNLDSAFASVATTKQGCPGGHRRDTTGNCIPSTRSKTAQPRCRNGTRRDKISGLCIPRTLPSTIAARR